VAAPYLARDLNEWLAARSAPAWARTPAAQAGVAAVAMLAWSGLESTREAFTLGIGLEPTSIPQAACDFIEKQGVRGRCFNYFDQGGYLLWPFWPQRARFPFMPTIPEIAPPAMRLAYQRASMLQADWRTLDDRYRFDYVLLRRLRDPGDHSLDFLDADSTFALAFLDD